MAVARAPLHQKLCSGLPVPFLTATSTSSRSRFSTTCIRTEGRQYGRWIPHACQLFMRLDGTLHTTPENVDFLREYDIEHDAANSSSLKGDADINKVCTDFGVLIRYSRRHLIHPFDLQYFDPRGHPLITAQRQRYAEKARTQPLWFITTGVNDSKAVVRHTAQRRLRASLYLALEEQGYDRYGNGKGKQLRGTVLVHVRDPLKAVSQPLKSFGGPIVKHLLKLRDQPASRECEPRKKFASGRQSDSRGGQIHKPRPQSQESERPQGQKSESRASRPKPQSKKPRSRPIEHDEFHAKFQSRR